MTILTQPNHNHNHGPITAQQEIFSEAIAKKKKNEEVPTLEPQERNTLPPINSTTTDATTGTTTDNPPSLSNNDSSLSNGMSQRYAPSSHAHEESDDEKGDVQRKTKLVNKRNTNKNSSNNNENYPEEEDNFNQHNKENGDQLEADNEKQQCNTTVSVYENNHDSNSIAISTKSPANKNSMVSANEGDQKETNWEKVLLDAEEFDSLIFSIRRPTARSRLAMLTKQMKQLAAKLKRHHEVIHVLRAAALVKAPGKKRSIDEIEKGSNDNEQSSLGNKRIKLENKIKGSDNVGTATQIEIPLFAMDRTARPNVSLGTTSSGTPLLKEKDKFVQHHHFGSNLHCPDYDATRTCPLGKICHHLHVYRPPSCKTCPPSSPTRKQIYFTRDDLKRAYETQRNVTLTRTEFSEKIKADSFNVPKYTLGFICPIDKTLYYAQPVPSEHMRNAITQHGGGQKSSQGIWWFRNMKEASDALSTLVLDDLIRREVITSDFQPEKAQLDIDVRKKSASARAASLARTASVENTPVLKTKRVAPVGLPQIHPWNWMEVHYEARCVAFHSGRGCARGIRCRNAHVHYPTAVRGGYSEGGAGNGGGFPDLGAMPRAYHHNFGMVLDDPFFEGESCGLMVEMRGSSVSSRHILRGRSTSFFRTKSAVDARSQIWYTAAWKCPREGIIYYAAGGRSGKVNNQNMFLYPSVEHAKLAVCGVVLNGFASRGMMGDWDVPELPPSATIAGRDGQDNRRLIPKENAAVNSSLTRQSFVSVSRRNMSYIKSDRDASLLINAEAGCGLTIDGGNRVEDPRMMHRQEGHSRIIYAGGETGDDHGLEKELFG